MRRSPGSVQNVRNPASRKPVNVEERRRKCDFLEKITTAVGGINHFLEDLLSQDLCIVMLQKVYFGFLSDSGNCNLSDI